MQREKVKWYKVIKGYGFIKRNDKDEDVFVHHTAIIRNNPQKRVKILGEGEIVEFDVVMGKQGTEAYNVTGPNGQHVKGSSYAASKRKGKNKGFNQC